MVSHPRVIVLIQAVPSAPASHLHLTPPSVLPLPRISPSLSADPVSTSSLPKHNFRGQTKRVGVAYNEARSFVSSAFSCYPFSCPAQRCPCRRLNLNSDDPEIPEGIIDNCSAERRELRIFKRSKNEEKRFRSLQSHGRLTLANCIARN